MKTKLVSKTGYAVYEIPANVPHPDGWVMEAISTAFGKFDIYRPSTVAPAGKLPGEHRIFGRERSYHWPWIVPTATRDGGIEETRKITANGVLVGYEDCGWKLPSDTDTNELFE